MSKLVIHEQNVICGKTNLDGTTHEQTMICKHVICRSRGELSANERQDKIISNVDFFYLQKVNRLTHAFVLNIVAHGLSASACS